MGTGKRRIPVPNWYDPKRVIVYESSREPMKIVPGKPETGRVLEVYDDDEKTLLLQFPHPDGAVGPRTNRVAMVSAKVFHGFGAKTGNWHYDTDAPPKEGPAIENVKLRDYSTAELMAEVKRREAPPEPPPPPGDTIEPNAKVEQHRVAPPPPPPPVDPVLEAKIEEQKQKAIEAAKSEAKFVKIKRKRGKKWITIPRIKPESMKEGDVIIGVVEKKNPEKASATPEEPVKEEVPAEA